MISVIIPVYNRSTYLKKALDSVKCQKGVQFEIIIVDDNSTEDLSLIIKKYQCVYIKNTENKGAQYSRNKGAEISRYPYIAFLDSDDVWHCNNKLKSQLEIIRNNSSISLVYTPLRLINENDEIIREAASDNGIKTINNPLNAMLSKDFIGTYSSVLIRKDVFFSVGRCDEKLPARQDWDLWLRLSEKGGIVEDSRTSISYRMHSNQISSSGEKKLTGYMCVLEKHFNTYHLTLKTKTAYYKNLFKVALLVGIVGCVEKCHLPFIDMLIIKYFSKLSLICKVPFIGHLFIKILRKTYLFKGVTIK